MGPPRHNRDNEKWFMVVGSGPTSYDAGVGQTGQNVRGRHHGPHDLDRRRRGHHVRCLGRRGHSSELLRRRFGRVRPRPRFPNRYHLWRENHQCGTVGRESSFVSRPAVGALSSPVCNTNPGVWGVPSGTAGVQAPSEILYQFKDGAGATNTLGPIPSGVGVTIDQTGNTWVFAGTGRYFTQTSGTGDKIDTSLQYLVGIKDSVMRGSSGCVGGDVSITGCRLDSTLSNELIDMSTATICQLGNGTCDGTTTTQVTSVPAMPGGGTYASLLALVQSKSGWFTKLTVPAEASQASEPWPVQPWRRRDRVLPDLHSERRRLRRSRDPAISMHCIMSPAAPTRRPSLG